MLARSRKSKILSPLRGRTFRRIFVGSGLAMLADQLFFIALTLLVLEVAEPGLQLGSVLAAALETLFLSAGDLVVVAAVVGASGRELLRF